MFELVILDLRLLQFCSGLLILLSLTSPILQGCFSTLYVLECPAPGLLVADFICYSYLSIVLTIVNACLRYCNTFSLSGFSSFGHTASSCLLLEVFMTIIHLNPNSELMI